MPSDYPRSLEGGVTNARLHSSAIEENRRERDGEVKEAARTAAAVTGRTLQPLSCEAQSVEIAISQLTTSAELVHNT